SLAGASFAVENPRPERPRQARGIILRRRDFLSGAGGLSLAIAFALQAPRVVGAPEKGKPFDAAMVRELARDRARQPYQAPKSKLPPSLANIDYDAYRTLRFRPDQAL